MATFAVGAGAALLVVVLVAANGLGDDCGPGESNDPGCAAVASAVPSASALPDAGESASPRATRASRPPRTATPSPTATLSPTASPTPAPTAPPTPPPTAAPTPPPTATSPPVSNQVAVLVGAGDIATCSDDGDEATADLLDRIAGTVFTTGDHAYSDGTEQEFAQCYHPSWGRHRDRTFPSPGNHDYHVQGAAAYFDYFGSRAGGPAGYYAYDLGAWRIYSLNSEVLPQGQVSWLANDLAANPHRCVLAYWHHPRFSTGRHGDDKDVQPLWETLVEAGAEVVVNGHDHNYERFAPMNAAGERDDARGVRQFVVGTGGAGLRDFASNDPNSQVRDASSHGVLKLTLSSQGYSWEFVRASGGFTDSGSGTCH